MTPDDNHHCCSACTKDDHCTHGVLTAWYEGYDRGVRNTLEVESRPEPIEQDRLTLTPSGTLHGN